MEKSWRRQFPEGAIIWYFTFFTSLTLCFNTSAFQFMFLKIQEKNQQDKRVMCDESNYFFNKPYK